MQFYWLTAFGSITGDWEFCQIWGLCWNINKNISFPLRLLPRKTNDNIFQKIQKTLFWGPCDHFGLFCPNLGKNEFSWKKTLSAFKYSNYLSLCQKSEKINVPFLRKMLNWQMDGQTDRGKTDNHDFVGPSVRQGPIIKVTLSFLNLYQNTRNQFIPLISLWDTANFRFLQPEWAHPFMTMPIPIFFNQLLISINSYQHAKN